MTGFSAQLSMGIVSTESYGKALEAVSKESLYTVADFEGQMSMLLYADASEYQVIVSEVLGIDRPEGDRDLSPVEQSLAEMFITELGDALCEGWMGAQKINIETSPIAKDPRKTRLYRSKDLMTQTMIEVTLKEGKAKLNLLMPKQPTCDLLDTLVDSRSAVESAKPSERLIASLPIDVTAVVGTAKIPMLDLTSLQPGQLIKLDQRIDQPIIAYVDDRPFYKCWPGRSGNTQSIEISCCLDERANGEVQ
ncbi:FliM/FliN family flagellar motor switch protein [Stieleria varia]|nr:FliM/FliN family flagellar motor switch protein [Stieleria varia]